jgi:hypothetical protein
MENWQEIKQNVYHEDGSLRDIYVNDTTLEDWRKWIDFVNQNYLVKVYSATAELNFIDFQHVKNYFKSDSDDTSGLTAVIFLKTDIEINCHFFWEGEIENDFQPGEIQTYEQHLAILKYLKDISRRLEKKVILTAESMKDIILIEIEGDNVKYFF